MMDTGVADMRMEIRTVSARATARLTSAEQAYMKEESEESTAQQEYRPYKNMKKVVASVVRELDPSFQRAVDNDPFLAEFRELFFDALRTGTIPPEVLERHLTVLADFSVPEQISRLLNHYPKAAFTIIQSMPNEGANDQRFSMTEQVLALHPKMITKTALLGMSPTALEAIITRTSKMNLERAFLMRAELGIEYTKEEVIDFLDDALRTATQEQGARVTDNRL